MERDEIPHGPCYLGVPSAESKMIAKPMVHLSCIKINTISKRTELSLESCHLGVPLDVSKIIFELMERLVQTVHLSSPDTNTICKQHMTHVT
jgi:hypothetical protein